MCSKQDYEAIARLIARQVYKDKLQAEGQGEGVSLTELVDGLADHFKQGNQCFNRDRFESACYTGRRA
jgi:hypothetical protein